MYLLFFVSRLRVESRIKTPVIYLRYKAATDGCEGVDFNEQLLNAFCFPLGPEAVQPKEVQASEEYTFTLTHNDGQRFTGFCRQIFPPAPRVGSKARYPQVLCIVAENPWCNFFFKVLQVAEQILKGYDDLLDSAHKELPLDSKLGAFVVDLRRQLATNPGPGQVLRVMVPNVHSLLGVSPPRSSSGDALNWSDDCIELQVPPDCGNGKDNSGIPLARLLFHVPVEGMLTLVASLLLERRIVFVARSRDTVTAAVQAAQALIYPFKWHHIYLPILPRDLVDYLAAPMPFLVGLTSDMLPLIRHIPMSEVTTVDLDLQKVFPPPGALDDGRALPYGRHLGKALEAVFRTVRSPTECESSPVITGVMQEYFVRLFGSYRRFIHDEGEPLLRKILSASAATGSVSKGGGRDSARGGRDARDSRGSVGCSAGGDTAPSPPAPHNSGRLHDDMLRGHGYYFDQPAFVMHRRSETVRSFLNAMRHSQQYQMFIQERLQMAACGAIDLGPSSNCTHSFSYNVAAGGRMRLAMAKSSSANNLTSLEQVSQGSAYGPGGGYTSDLPCLREPSSGGQGSAPCTPSTSNPFEVRIDRYPEKRRWLRERLRSIVAESGPTGSAGGGKLASKLRRHRRTDSEDLHSHPQPFGGVHGGDSMRRITTYPGLLDVSTPTLDDPSSYFAEWDLHEDDDDGSASPSPSPRDREHLRSESGNSLQSADSGEAAGPNGSQPPAAASGASSVFASRPAGARDRESGRDSTPVRRLSVPTLANNAKSTYMSLRGTPSNESPAAGAGLASTSGPLVPASGGGGAGTRLSAAVTNLFNGNGGAGEAAVAATVVKGGVQVKTLVDGNRVYDGSMKDFIRLGIADAKHSLLSGLSGLTSPLSSPREKESAGERRARAQAQQQRQFLATLSASTSQQQQQAQQSQQGPHHPLPQHGPSPLASESGCGRQASVPLPGAAAGPVQGPVQGPARAPMRDSGGGGSAGPAVSSRVQSASFTAAPAVGRGSRSEEPQQSRNNISTFLSGLKDKMALGILPTPTYKPQTTGERAAKFKAQLTGGGGASLLAGADGKLKQPHAPQRPLSLAGGQNPPWARPDGGDSFSLAPPPPTPSFGTPLASPPAPGTPSEAGGPPEVSPFAPRGHMRAQSLSGMSKAAAMAPGLGEIADDGGLSGNGDATPPTGATISATGMHWRGSGAHPPAPWDPFGPGSAPPAAGTTYSAASNSNWSAAAGHGPVAAATTSPFAATSRLPPPAPAPPRDGPAGAMAAAAAGSSCGISTADLLGLSPSAASGVSSSFVPAQAASSVAFDPFVASDYVTQSGRLESAGSNDFAAFASASSPREFPGVSPLGSASLVG